MERQQVVAYLSAKKMRVTGWPDRREAAITGNKELSSDS
jgi:hypothetical protein